MTVFNLYLDNCCFNRPYDDQTSTKVRIETESKLDIQANIKNGRYKLLWSYILEYENHLNPFPGRREEILEWKKLASKIIAPSQSILNNALKLLELGIRHKDALHIACAMSGNADYFITTDNQLLKKKTHIQNLVMMNPIEFIESEEDYEK